MTDEEARKMNEELEAARKATLDAALKYDRDLDRLIGLLINIKKS